MGDNHLHDCPTEDLLASIEKLQARQKRVPPTDPDWEAASECLAPLFSEMAQDGRCLCGQARGNCWWPQCGQTQREAA